MELFFKNGNFEKFKLKNEDIIERLIEEISTFDDEQKQLIYKHKPIIYFCFVYSTFVWDSINKKLGLRTGVTAMSGGVQIAANNMPQGEIIQIPLSKNIGRQKQAFVMVHFDNCNSDLGRKGFQKDITELAKAIAAKIITGPINKYKKCFKRNSGASPDLMREQELAEWKNIMADHELAAPLTLTNENFFVPTKQISMTSIPTREQDVIALFNQLIAGGVIRGIKIMSTNERFIKEVFTLNLI